METRLKLGKRYLAKTDVNKIPMTPYNGYWNIIWESRVGFFVGIRDDGKRMLQFMADGYETPFGPFPVFLDLSKEFQGKWKLTKEEVEGPAEITNYDELHPRTRNLTQE